MTINKFDIIVKDIKSLKIQGAQNIAKQAANAILYRSVSNKAKESEILIKDLLKSKESLFKTRTTEPTLRNALNYITKDLDKSNGLDTQEIKTKLKSRVKFVLDFFNKADKKIFDFGAKKIKKGSIVYTHCHSSTVMGIIKNAWNNKKRFEVHNTETRPRFQGRLTAKELARLHIPITHYVDSAMRFAIKKADIVLIGADAITVEGKIVNKVGSELVAETAANYDVPIYVCTNSWKFDPATIFGFDEPIEKRYSKEVWQKPPKGVKIDNFAFEKIDPQLIDGIISEIGVFSPTNFFYAINKKYPWMF